MKNQDYKQPAFYHFSRDAIELSNYVAKKYKHQRDLVIADIFCGCAVIGLETALKHGHVKKIYFVEKQNEYFEYIQKNINQFAKSVVTEVLIQDVINLNFTDDLDIILFNPPYFEENEGRKPASIQKDFCHFIKQSEFDLIFHKLIELTKHQISIYFTMRIDSNLILNSIHKDFFREVLRISTSVGIFTTQLKNL